MADVKYKDSTPVDEPVSRPKMRKLKPMPAKVKPRPLYPDSVPVDEPVSPAPAGMPAMKRGGSVGSASRRADGIAQKGKTKGRMI